MRVLDLSHGDIHNISYEELRDQFEKDIHRIKVLEEALDSACHYLDMYSYKLSINDPDEENYTTKEKWKKRLMEDYE